MDIVGTVEFVKRTQVAFVLTLLNRPTELGLEFF
jgi:hypothetical protein